ncbi:uncharacterized protein B0H64DRAFT_448084 [Chaetomium fimeti]|uniref:Nudix hydrolase domain-containing protein n=1 Tax=Chaetomium fimeti TaxID=1854472 RepID=A0AAE0LWD1_9PEZI|nr:hypothetical protein B0H64DRAFT_448084 [Chaetomium fimeti]
MTANMPLPQSPDISSSTLGWSGPDAPVHHPLAPPPRREVERYGKRALPPVPLHRHSGVSAFSKEVDDALATPAPVVSPAEGSIYLMFCDEPTDNGHAEITYNPDKPADKHLKKEGLKVNTAGVPGAGFETLRSPQPQHKLSISKIQKMSGINAPTYRETTPTGHDSAKKIQRVTGIGVPSEAIQQQKRIREEHKIQTHGEEVSPLSNSGSDYGLEEPKTAVSELDGDGEGHGKGYFSRSGWGYFGSGHPYRRKYWLNRPAEYGGYSPRPLLSPRLESERASPGWNSPSKFTPDLYHETIKEVAQAGAHSPLEDNRIRRAQLATQQFLQGSNTSSTGSHGSPGPKPLPPLPVQHGHHRQPGHSSDTRPSGSAERIQPVWRPSNPQQEAPRAVSASTFGRHPNRFHAQQHSTTPSPSPSRDPQPPSKFDFDSDSDTNPNTTGTPNTGSSIPVSIPSDLSEGTTPNRPHRRHRHRHSSSGGGGGGGIIAKVFHHHRTSATSMTTAPGTPPPPVPTNTPQQPSFPQGTTTTTTTTATTYPPSLRPSSNPNPYPYTPSQPSNPNPNTNPGLGGPKSKTAVASLAARTTGLVGAAADFILARAAGAGTEERRRQRLKSSIRVLGDGGQVLSGGDGDGNGNGALAPETMSASLPTEEQPPVQVQVGSPEHQEEVQTVIQSIQDAPASDTALPLPADLDGEAAELPSEVDEEEEEEEEERHEGSNYWDASTMAPLNAASAAAIARLRAYKPPPFPLWDRLPVSRRAAVLMLLYADKRGDLRVVITMRAASLRSFSGHAALPGGKADTLDESPYQIARREAWEEIGLPLDDNKLPAPFRIEHLCYLPMNLARTELVVRPCVALLHTGDTAATTNPTPTTTTTTKPPASPSPTVEESLIPRLDAKEVAAVFSAPFHNFLRETDEVPAPPPPPATPPTTPAPSASTAAAATAAATAAPAAAPRPLPAGNWYEGSWTTWHDSQWRMHFFYVPVTDQTVVKPRVREGGLAALSEGEGEGERGGEEGGGKNKDGDGDGDGDGAGKKKVAGGGELERYKVWGMTARMLVDAATVAYAERPEFEHNRHFGDEGIIETLASIGRMGEKKRAGSVVSAEDWKKAKEAEAKRAKEKEKEKEKGEPSKM